MNLKLFYDKETTGKPLYSEPSSDPRQPHIVQLGARLVDVGTAEQPRRTVLSTLDVIIKPEGWTIPDDIAVIHGVTTELAMLVGVHEVDALRTFLGMWRAADERISHNEPFDARIVRIAIKRLLGDDALADEWKAGSSFCTQRASVNHCQLPPTDAMLARNNRSWKTPTLGEAYAHFTGRPMERAHNALADVDACIDVYLGIRQAEAYQATATA